MRAPDAGPDETREWAYARENAAMRYIQLGVELETMREALDDLKAVAASEAGGDVLKADLAILHLFEATAAFYAHYHDLGREEWFINARNAIGSAHWRVEKGVIDKDPEQLRMWADRIVREAEGPGRHDLVVNIRQFIERRGHFLSTHDVEKTFERDVREARDLYSLGYYQTSLFVLGRAVERGLLELGELRGLLRIEPENGKPQKWEDAKFAQRGKALHRLPLGPGKMTCLNRREYHEVAILANQRNEVAHSDYTEMPDEEGERMVRNAFSLLVAISHRTAELKKTQPRPPAVEVVAIKEVE